MKAEPLIEAGPWPLAVDGDCPRTFRLPGGWAVTFRVQPGTIEAAWEPEVPTGRAADLLVPAYLLARNAFLETVLDQLAPPAGRADV